MDAAETNNPTTPSKKLYKGIDGRSNITIASAVVQIEQNIQVQAELLQFINTLLMSCSRCMHFRTTVLVAKPRRLCF